jgi:very-short-patch-repair endonuclease
MPQLIILVIAIGVMVFVYGILSGSLNKPQKYTYKQKNFFMSRAEHECYDALVIAVGEKYHIFPQVHLPSIVDSKVIGQNWKWAFKHINQKSVDFVLCDKVYISPKLVIELDDRTHERKDRIDRDIEVERILKDAGLPLLRLENHGKFDSNGLIQKIDEILLNRKI